MLDHSSYAETLNNIQEVCLGEKVYHICILVTGRLLQHKYTKCSKDQNSQKLAKKM